VITTQSAQTAGGRGVYGLRLDTAAGGVPVDESLLVEAGGTWPTWEVGWEQLPSATPVDPPVVESWSADHAVLAAQPSGWIGVDRAAARTTLHLMDPPNPAAVLHPYLASTAVVAGHWLGRTPFHGGAFVVGERAWGVLGGRNMGKSSLLMGVHRTGASVLADDVVVIDGGVVYSGPRCLDLRKSAAEQFDAGTFLGTIGTRERWRVTLPPVPGEVPFGGWVLLDWGDEVTFERPDATERLTALVANAGLTAPGGSTPGILDLVDHPMIRFRRPRDWAQADGALEQLIGRIASIAPQTT
jgi:hypothetical protein